MAKMFIGFNEMSDKHSHLCSMIWDAVHCTNWLPRSVSFPHCSLYHSVTSLDCRPYCPRSVDMWRTGKCPQSIRVYVRAYCRWDSAVQSSVCVWSHRICHDARPVPICIRFASTSFGATSHLVRASHFHCPHRNLSLLNATGEKKTFTEKSSDCLIWIVVEKFLTGPKAKASAKQSRRNSKNWAGHQHQHVRVKTKA